VRVEAARISRRQLATGPPADGVELAGVRAQFLIAGAGQDVPEADVRVSVVLPDRTRDGQKDRRPRQTRIAQTKLFLDLPPRGQRGVLIDLDVTTRRQPQPGVDVVDEQDPPVRGDRHDVGHQVLRRGRRLDPAEHVVRARQPGQR
jgi:hypothetical protein